MKSKLNTTSVPGCLSFKNLNTPLPHLYMDDNNDEFCPMPMFKGMPLTSSGLFHFSPPHELNAKALKRSLNALTSISTSHNPNNDLSYLGPSIPMLSNMTTPPPAPGKREF